MAQLVTVTVEVKGVRLAKLLVRAACPLIKVVRLISPRASTAIACITMTLIPKLIRVRAT